LSEDDSEQDLKKIKKTIFKNLMKKVIDRDWNWNWNWKNENFKYSPTRRLLLPD